MADPQPPADQIEAAVQTYVYGYPLVYNLGEIAGLVAGRSALGAPAPLNTFGAARNLLGPDAKFVTPNNDTLYLIAACDLSGGPRALVDPDPALVAVLVEGQRQGAELIETLSRTSVAIVDGWSTALHAFDCNLDHLGPGTIDAPEWRIADRRTAYVTRAVAARLGLWGNHGYEADYHILWQDEHGEFLDGSRHYELTLSPPPPVGAFWSLTMYDEPDYYLVDNPIDRYSIGDRTPGVQVADDGSITIVMQHESPGPDREANWLPAPRGAFRPVLRSYQPGPALLDGSYRSPGVKRID